MKEKKIVNFWDTIRTNQRVYFTNGGSGMWKRTRVKKNENGAKKAEERRKNSEVLLKPLGFLPSYFVSGLNSK